MKASTIKCALVATVALGAGASLAQEMGATTVATSSVQEESAPVVGIESSPDQGPEMAVASQTNSPAFPAEKVEGQRGMRRNARSELIEKIGAKYTIGYDEDRGSIIQIGFAQAPVEDPAKSANFIQVRDMLAREASLNAKMAIAKMARQKVNAFNRVATLGTRENLEYSKKYAADIAACAQQQEKVKKLLGLLDEAEAKQLEGVTIGDRWNALMDAIIVRIDAKYNKSQITEDKKKYQEIKQAYEEAKRQLDDLKKKAETVAKPVGENESEMGAQAEIKLLGATPLMQTESYDGKNYQVAMAIVWSPKLQERAVKTLGGGVVSTSQKGEMSLNKWLQKNNASLASMVGARQYSDHRGRQYIIGVSACEVSDDVNMQQQDMERTDLFAQQAVLFALFSDGQSDQKAREHMKKYSGNNPNDTTATYAKDVWESVPKDFAISGLGKVYDTQLIHPISGKEIYVSVAAVDGAMASKSSKILRSMFGAASAAAIAGNYLRGELQGLSDGYQAAKDSPAAFNKGRQSGQNSLAEDLKGRFNVDKENSAGGVRITPVQAPRQSQPQSQQGVFTGDQKINDDF